MKRIKLLALVVSVAFSGAAFSGAQIMATSNNAKSQAKVALDLVTDGDVSAFQFEVPLKNAKVVDFDNCTSELPSTHIGTCALDSRTNRLKVIVYSATNASFPQGAVSIGHISLNSSTADIKVESIELVSTDGKQVSQYNSESLDKEMNRDEELTPTLPQSQK